MCLPYLGRLFHPVPIHGLLLIFLVLWVARRTSALAWATFFGGLIAAFVWRLDVGFAGSIASIATLLVLRVTMDGYRLPLRAMVAGAIGTGALVFAVVGGLSAWRGVDLLDWLRDMSHVARSNQAFGYATIAHEFDPTVMWHLFGLPVVMVLACAWMVVRFLGRLDIGSPTGRAFVVCIFLAAFTVANVPRGLVRHSFLEGEMAMTSVFTLGCLAIVPACLLETVRVRSVLAVFVLVSSLLASTFGLRAESSMKPKVVTPHCELAPGVMTTMYELKASRQPIVRAPISDYWKWQHIAGIRGFMENHLEPQQTFLDLSSSPLLYFHLRRPSPQWLNHVLIAHDEYLQDRVLEEWSRWDAPFIVMPAEHDMALSHQAHVLDNLDGVEMRLRLHKLFEYAYARYQPHALVGRWPVWVRKDWMQLCSPRAPQNVSVFEWTVGQAGASGPALIADPGSTTIEIGSSGPMRVPRVLADRNSSLYLRITLECDREGTLDLEWNVTGPSQLTECSRELRCPAGSIERFYVLPMTHESRDLESLRIGEGAGVRLQAVELLRCVSRETTALPPRALASVVSNWGRLARLWGTYDPPRGPGYRTLRTLHENVNEPSYALNLGPRERSGLSVTSTSVHRFQFEPIEQTERGTYLVVRLRSGEPVVQDLIVDYGVGAESRGRFLFQADEDGLTHVYAIRLSTQFNWASERNRWISVIPSTGTLEIEQALIVGEHP